MVKVFFPPLTPHSPKSLRKPKAVNINAAQFDSESEAPPTLETKILNNNMNPFQFKSSIFSRFSSPPKCLLLRCINIVCWRTENVYYPLALLLLARASKPKWKRVFISWENVGSNIIFSSAMAKRLAKGGREKDSPDSRME